MGFWVCKYCNNSAGKLRHPDAKWWQFWRVIDCPACEGDGHLRPPSGQSHEDSVRRIAAFESRHKCDESMAIQADIADAAREMFLHAQMMWNLGEETLALNGFAEKYDRTVRGFQRFVFDYFEHYSTCERSGGGSFRDHQQAMMKQNRKTI